MEYKRIEWNGYSGVEFEFDGLPAKVIMPKCEPNGKWMLKTEYFGAFPSLERELLGRGWHLAYNQNINRWAEPRDIERKIEFIDFVAQEFSLSPRCLPVGMSCGGLYAVKLAAKAPDRIEGLYLDAPVMNLLSCPFYVGRHNDNPSMIDEYIRCTGRDLSAMLSYREHPIDLMHVLSDNHIPVVMVAGDSDTVVPYSENGRLLEEHYREQGLDIDVYIKQGCNHHPHGLADAVALADAIEKAIEVA